MINFLFFPFACLTQRQLETVFTYFSSFQYLPLVSDFENQRELRQLLSEKRIDPVFSPQEELLPVERKAEEYFAWAESNRGNEKNLKVFLRDRPWFTDDSGVANIKSGIKGGDEPEKRLLPGKEFYDLFFLKLSQIFDRQNEEIDLKLNRLEKSREEFLFRLRGMEIQDRRYKAPDDSGFHMTRERIVSWAGYLGQKGLLNKPGQVLITTSPAVFHYMISVSEDVVNALDISNIKVHEDECENKGEWQSRFYDYLHGILEKDTQGKLPDVNDRCSLFGQVKLYLFAGGDIDKIFDISGRHIPVCLIKLKG